MRDQGVTNPRAEFQEETHNILTSDVHCGSREARNTPIPGHTSSQYGYRCLEQFN